MQQFYANGRAMPVKADSTTQVTVYPPRHIHNQNVFLQDPIKKIVTTRTGINTTARTNLKTRRIVDSFNVASATVREVFDVSSEYPRDLFDTGSGAVREVFDCCSGGSRRTTEAHPKQYRSCPEPVPKRTRSAPEGHPNSTRRNRLVFYRFLGILKAGIKYRCSKDVVPFTQRLRKIAEVPLMYRECTVSVRGVYRKGTGDLLRSYWRSTTDPLNTCTSGVDQRYSNSRRVVDVLTTKVTLCWAELRHFSRKLLSLMASKNKSMPSVLALICFMLFNLSTAWAQSAESRTAEGQPEIKPLQIGDTIPEELWHLPLQITNQDGTNKIVSLDEYRGRLIILDFWATWCASCIQGFPKAERLQERYAEKIKVLLVNPAQSKDTPERINQTFKRYEERYGYSPSLDILLHDTVFQRLFPYNALPHIVWIDREGVFRAGSDGTFLNQTTVSAASRGDFTGIDQKDDLRFQEKHPLITDMDGDNRIASTLHTGYIPGLGVRSQHVVEREGLIAYQIANHTLRYIYQIAYEEEFMGIFANRWVFSEAVTKEFIAHFRIFGKDRSKFCFEAAFPSTFTDHQAHKLLREHLENTFGVRAVRKSTPMEVFVLKATAGARDFKSKGGIPEIQLDPSQGDMYVRNVSLRTLMNCFGDLLNKSFEVETDVDIKIDFLFPHDITDFNEQKLITYLQDNGIAIKQVNKELEYVLFEHI